MTTLYVDRKGVSMRVDGGTLVFEEAGARVGCVPLGPIERVVLRGDVALQANVLGHLGGLGVGVLVLSGRKGVPTMLLHRPHNDAHRRVMQLRAAADADWCLKIATELVTRKLRTQQRLLLDRAESDLEHRFMLLRAAARVGASADAAIGAGGLDSLRGVEGAGAQAYFTGLRELFAPSLNFTGRNRRPPRDPVNAVLSLGYTLLHAEAVLQSYAGGLDPYVGFLHGLDFGRESLACDLVEPLRTGVDRLVIRLFRERELEAAHFSQAAGACLLGKAGRERFYRAWEAAAEGLRQALQAEVTALVAALQGRETPAAPDPRPGDAAV